MVKLVVQFCSPTVLFWNHSQPCCSLVLNIMECIQLFFFSFHLGTVGFVRLLLHFLFEVTWQVLVRPLVLRTSLSATLGHEEEQLYSPP